jgi:hypothetical protein
MKIYSAKTVQVEKRVSLEVSHDTPVSFRISVTTRDGKVIGNAKNGMATSYLKYFNDTDDKTKEKHFQQIKTYVEKHIK